MDYDPGLKACDSCGREFKALRKRFWCERCNKFFFICPSCKDKFRIPCPKCGTGLKKKAEPMR